MEKNNKRIWQERTEESAKKREEERKEMILQWLKKHKENRPDAPQVNLTVEWRGWRGVALYTRRESN